MQPAADASLASETIPGVARNFWGWTHWVSWTVGSKTNFIAPTSIS